MRRRDGRMAHRPNILLIHSDQHRWDCVGANGHPLIQTPHLDRLAAEGVNFIHAFTPNPVCAPARASLLTGTWPTTHRCVTIPGTETFQSADPALPVLTCLLADSGYRVAHVGKFHREVRGDPTDHGAERYIPYLGYRQWRDEQGLPPEPRTQGWFGEADPHISADQTSLHWQAEQVMQQIETFQNSDGPFFIRWDPPEPHLPNILPEPLFSFYPPEDIPPWPSFPDPLTNKSPAQKRTRQRWRTEDWTWEQWQPLVSRYLGVLTLLDDRIGYLLDALDRMGIAQDTLVLYSCDHGNMCGGHGMMDKHYVMYDDNMRVPLLMRWPGTVPAGKTCDAFVSQELDIAKTILIAAGIPPPPSFVGRDLIAEARGELPDPRTDIFAQYMGSQQGLYSMRMVRDRRWKYIYNPSGIDELYDLETDPGEIQNRIDNPDHADTLYRLQIRMGEWMLDIRDPLSPPLFVWEGAQRGTPNTIQ